MEVHASVGVGGMGILGAYQAETALADRHLVDGSGPRFEWIAELRVVRAARTQRRPSLEAEPVPPVLREG